MISFLLRRYDARTIENLCADLPAHARDEACAFVQSAVLKFGIAVDYENREITKDYLEDWGRRLAAVRLTIRTLEQNRAYFVSAGTDEDATLKGLAHMERELAAMIDHWRSLDKSRGATSSAKHEARFIVQIAHVWAKAHGIELAELKMSESRENSAMAFIESVIEPAFAAAKSRKLDNLPRHIKETVYETRRQITA
ncbi:hypothetical protein [Jiella sp. M17.18]|uniref:hypothetical protein n=1 Tax=Jiella sp. M17.18 TaxID=3234247 RepID=UPI0034DEA7E7